MNVHQPSRMSVEEFANWAETRERRYELVRGVPKLVPDVRRDHSKVAGNLLIELGRQIERDRYEMHAGNFAIRTSHDTIRHADVMVEAAGGPFEERQCEAPAAIFEVLSTSTMHEDFGAKKVEYLALPSVQAFVILAQDEPLAWIWLRGEDGGWPEAPEIVSGTGSQIPLPPLGAALSLAAIYRGVCA